ncbi:MAG: hypothetical protein QM765_26540 [Myxococcales bacterium]
MNQKTLLFAGMVLAILAIGASAANRTLKARDRAQREAAEAKADQQEQAARPLPPKSDQAALAFRRETVGELEVRVASTNNEARVFAKDGKLLTIVRGYAGGREVPGTTLFGAKVVELAGKACQDPCNPTSSIIASPGGKPKRVFEAQGIVRFEDLDGDGTPEVLVDHLVKGTTELIALPYALEKERFVPAYSRFPERLDRQMEAFSRTAERMCEQAPEGDCRDALLALLLAHAFTGRDDLKDYVSHLKIDSQLKDWARDGALQRELQREAKTVAR